MNQTKLASTECYIAWKSDDAFHRDWQYFSKVDFWRDFFPQDLNPQLPKLNPGENTETCVSAGELFPAPRANAIKRFKLHDLSSVFYNHHIPGPFVGRFYPRGLLADCKSEEIIYPQDMTPVRITGLNGQQVEVDFNHPMSKFDLTVGVKIEEILAVKEQRGGQCNDIVNDIAVNGSGLQCYEPHVNLEQNNHNDFSCLDTLDDRHFYTTPRLVHHIDSQAQAIINQLYRKHIKPNMRVLDLMSSWLSHVNGIDDSVHLTGLGMNLKELQSNPRLQSFDVWDLNQNPALPYPDQSFDLAVCTVSVEYLIQPVEVFRQVARILRSGGRFIITFSDRWFPEKVVRIWTELHPYERMGLVLDYLRRTQCFSQLESESWHGWSRPADDNYFPKKLLSDPVFSVQGVKN